MFNILKTPESNLVTAQPKRGVKSLAPLLNQIRDRAFICGGMARYILSEDDTTPEPADIDVYALSDAAYTSLYEDFNKKLHIVHDSVGATSFSSTLVTHPEEKLIQLIKPEVIRNEAEDGTPEEGVASILSKFDFTIACAAVTSDGVGYTHPKFQQHDLQRRLVIEYINCPIATTLRMFKYYKKGYWASAMEVIKCLEHWRNLTPDETREKAQLLLSEAASSELTANELKDLYSLITFVD